MRDCRSPCNTLTELDIISMCFIAINYLMACFTVNYYIIITIIVSLLLVKTLKLPQFILKYEDTLPRLHTLQCGTLMRRTPALSVSLRVVLLAPKFKGVWLRRKPETMWISKQESRHVSKISRGADFQLEVKKPECFQENIAICILSGSWHIWFSSFPAHSNPEALSRVQAAGSPNEDRQK